jgi:hypothetical protein
MIFYSGYHHDLANVLAFADCANASLSATKIRPLDAAMPLAILPRETGHT